MSCTYKSATGTEAVGHTREYAEALQRINKLYKLSAGKFVQPDILMSRLLSLPRGFDHVVETIESINSTRAGLDQRPLDFHETRISVLPAHMRSSPVGGLVGYPLVFLPVVCISAVLACNSTCSYPISRCELFVQMTNNNIHHSSLPPSPPATLLAF